MHHVIISRKKERSKSLSQNKKNEFLKNKLPIIVIFFLWAFIVSFTLYVNSDTLGKISSGSEVHDCVKELTSSVVVKETMAIEENADAVAVMMATYARKNSGKIYIQVKGETSNKVYAYKEYDVAYIQDNAFLSIPLNEKLNSENDKRIIITINSNCSPGKAPGIYYSSDKVFDYSTLSFNNSIERADLTVRFLSENDELMLFYHIVITWIVLGLTFILFLLLVIRPKYEILFTAMAIIFGLTFLVIITPMSPPDETMHYEFSLQVSNKMMGVKDYTMIDEEYINYSDFAGHMNVSAAYKRLIKRFNRPLSLDEHDIELVTDIDWRYHVPYVPQASAITIARLLKLNFLKTFYLGRLFNLIFYTICVYVAVKRTPVHKVLFGTLSVLPIFMQQAASYSYDSFVNGLSLVTISCFMNLLYKENTINLKDILFVTVVSILLSPAKAIYSFFFLLFWFIPKEKYGGIKFKLLYMLLICSPAIYQIADIFIPYIPRIYKNITEALNTARTATGISYAKSPDPVLSSEYVKPYREPGEDTFTIGQLIRDPYQTFMLFYRTVRYSIKNWFYGAFGRSLSGESLILPTYLVHSLLGIVIAVALMKEPHVESIGIKVLFFLVCVAIGFSVMAGMLLSWTETNQEIVQDFGGMMIQGIQGRYFSPLLPFVFPILNNRKITIPRKFDIYILSFFVMIVFEVMVYVLSYTFLN